MTFGRILKRFIVPALLAAAGIWAFYLLFFQWVLAMTAEGMIAADLPFAIGGILSLPGAVAVAAAVPMLRIWQPGTTLAATLAVFLGLSGLLGAAGTIVTGAVLVCPDLCTPGQTWTMLPSMIVTGLLAAVGPGFYALARNSTDDSGLPDTRGQVWWGLSAAFWFLGFMSAMLFWVEVWLFAG